MKKVMLAVLVAGLLAAGRTMAQLEAVDPVVVQPVVGATYPLLWMEGFRIFAGHAGSNVSVSVSYWPYRYLTNNGVVVRDFALAVAGESAALRKRVVKVYSEADVAASPVLQAWVAGIVGIADALAVSDGLVKP
jgi:hypothetical protein